MTARGKGVHDGHRERMRARIKKYGLSSLEEHEQLEYLLYTFIPRKDTNPIAHALIDSFGSFRKVLDAEPQSLLTVPGMTENAALFLSSLPEIYTSYLNSEKQPYIKNADEASRRIMAMIGSKEQEHFVILLLDEAGYLIRKVTYTESRRSKVLVDRDKIVSLAVACHAKNVVLGHNHPSGNLLPSDDDILSTNRIAQSLYMVGIQLFDHVIVSEKEYYSMHLHNCIADPKDFDKTLSLVAEDFLRR